MAFAQRGDSEGTGYVLDTGASIGRSATYTVSFCGEALKALDHLHWRGHEGGGLTCQAVDNVYFVGHTELRSVQSADPGLGRGKPTQQTRGCSVFV
jgi:hypothetical protein